MYMWFIVFFRASIDIQVPSFVCWLFAAGLPGWLFAGLLVQNTKDEEIRCVLGTYCFYWIAGLPEINAVSILELVVYRLCCVHTLQGTRKLEYIVLLHVHIFCLSVVSYHDLKPNCMFAYCGPGMCFMKWMYVIVSSHSVRNKINDSWFSLEPYKQRPP